jgi:hypothetical protein
LSALDHYKFVTADRLASYEKSLSDQSAKIRKTEAQNLRDGRRRKRDLNAFRAALAELQRQVEELDGIKMGYHEEVLEGEGEVRLYLMPCGQTWSRDPDRHIPFGKPCSENG